MNKASERIIYLESVDVAIEMIREKINALLEEEQTEYIKTRITAYFDIISVLEKLV